jgi:hypothetical protein
MQESPRVGKLAKMGDRRTCKFIKNVNVLNRSAIDGVIEKRGASEKRPQNPGATSINENESFNRHYNKELKVSEGKTSIQFHGYR